MCFFLELVDLWKSDRNEFQSLFVCVEPAPLLQCVFKVQAKSQALFAIAVHVTSGESQTVRNIGTGYHLTGQIALDCIHLSLTDISLHHPSNGTGMCGSPAYIIFDTMTDKEMALQISEFILRQQTMENAMRSVLEKEDQQLLKRIENRYAELISQDAFRHRIGELGYAFDASKPGDDLIHILHKNFQFVYRSPRPKHSRGLIA